MKNTIHILLCLLVLLSVGVTGNAEERSLTHEGIVQGVDFAKQRVTINGRYYTLSPDVQVTIRGSYGTLPMLRRGMKVSVVYRQDRGGRATITHLDQLPDNRRIVEH